MPVVGAVPGNGVHGALGDVLGVTVVPGDVVFGVVVLGEVFGVAAPAGGVAVLAGGVTVLAGGVAVLAGGVAVLAGGVAVLAGGVAVLGAGVAVLGISPGVPAVPGVCAAGGVVPVVVCGDVLEGDVPV
ncbi:MAG: hypothetical protein DMG73_06580 [Acidobacteria bacterium]|nr:MAG: hypothetical protein DMG73_06580 [Acidobacteriota bacterium]